MFSKLEDNEEMIRERMEKAFKQKYFEESLKNVKINSSNIELNSYSTWKLDEFQ